MRAPTLATHVSCLVPSKQSDPTSDADLVVHRSSATSFIDFPPELLTAICASVECRSVVQCRLVCRRLRDVIDTSLELQYRIELVRDGMTDHHPASTSTASSSSHADADADAPSLSLARADGHGVALLTIGDRLDRLRRLRRAWKTLSWTRCVTVPMPGPCCAYELVGGIFCKTQPRVRRGRGVGVGVGVGAGFGIGFGNILGGWLGDEEGDGHGDDDGDGEGGGGGWEEEPQHVFGSRTMSTTWLPDADDSGHTVVRDDLGIPTRDFAIDPSQDLMVLFKGGEDAVPMAVVFPGALELHVRTISTNQTHPEARVPVLCTPVLYPVTSVFVQIVDDVVGMMYCVDPARPRITIWNWKTGNLVVDRSSGSLPPGTWDFSFINSRALLVTTADGAGSLELFTFTCDRVDVDSDTSSSSQLETQTQTQAYHAPNPNPVPISPLVHVATLELPPVHAPVRVLSVGTHTGPFLAGCPPDKPFATSNEDRIHVLTVQYVHLPTLEGPRTRPRMCVFVPNRALEAYLDKGAEKGTGAVTVVPWREWGRIHARMLPHTGIFQWLRYVHGQRVVMLLPTSETGKSTLQVLDFNARIPVDDDDDEDDADHIKGDKHDDNEHEQDADLSVCKTTVECVDYPTRIIMANIFTDVVESGLPYRETRRDVWGDYSGMMIDDERLVGLKYPAFLTGNMKEIDVFTM